MEELTFAGIVGLLDPPRDGIQDAILTLLSTGAHLKMVTGDAEETALAIGNSPPSQHFFQLFISLLFPNLAIFSTFTYPSPI